MHRWHVLRSALDYWLHIGLIVEVKNAGQLPEPVHIFRLDREITMNNIKGSGPAKAEPKVPSPRPHINHVKGLFLIIDTGLSIALGTVFGSAGFAADSLPSVTRGQTGPEADCPLNGS